MNLWISYLFDCLLRSDIHFNYERRTKCWWQIMPRKLKMMCIVYQMAPSLVLEWHTFISDLCTGQVTIPINPVPLFHEICMLITQVSVSLINDPSTSVSLIHLCCLWNLILNHLIFYSQIYTNPVSCTLQISL